MVSNSKPSPRLVIIEGKDKGKIIPLTDGTCVIGRSKGDVVIQDPRVSRSHVAVHYDSESGKLSYTDLKSLNGTMVNGEPGETGVLADGDLAVANSLFTDDAFFDEFPSLMISEVNEYNAIGFPPRRVDLDNILVEHDMITWDEHWLDRDGHLSQSCRLTADIKDGKISRMAFGG